MRLEAGPNLHTHESMYTEWGKDVELLLRILIHKEIIFTKKAVDRVKIELRLS